MCTAVLIAWDPVTLPLPRIWIWSRILRALLVSEDRRQLFVTLCRQFTDKEIEIVHLLPRHFLTGVLIFKWFNCKTVQTYHLIFDITVFVLAILFREFCLLLIFESRDRYRLTEPPIPLNLFDNP